MKPRLIAAGAALISAAALAQTQEGFRDVPPDVVAQVQTSLAARGFSPGPADGRLTPQAMEALRQWQSTRNFEATGQIDARTLSSLGLSTGVAANSIVSPGTTTVPNATVTVVPNAASQTATLPPAGTTSLGVVSPTVIPQGVGAAVPPPDPTVDWGLEAPACVRAGTRRR